MIYNLSNGSEARPLYNDCSQLSFGEYLQKSNENSFVLNLSNYTLLDVIEEYIKIKEKMSPSYRRNYSSLINNLSVLQKQFNCTLSTLQITDIFWNYFIPFMQGRGLAMSSIKTICYQLKSVLSWSSRHNAILSSTYDMLSLPSYRKKKIALLPDDISRITYFDISHLHRHAQHLRNLERVRDMFVLSCNLGQRYSDMIRIEKGNFNRNIFTTIQQKTGNKARVDIDQLSVDSNTTYRLLEKYDYHAPYPYDISKYNKLLKELMHYVGFSENIKIEEKINGVIKQTEEQKWDMITSHTARRSFVTINIVKGKTINEVMRGSGHTSYSSFQKYLCYEDD